MAIEGVPRVAATTPYVMHMQLHKSKPSGCSHVDMYMEWSWRASWVRAWEADRRRSAQSSRKAPRVSHCGCHAFVHGSDISHVGARVCILSTNLDVHMGTCTCDDRDTWGGCSTGMHFPGCHRVMELCNVNACMRVGGHSCVWGGGSHGGAGWRRIITFEGGGHDMIWYTYQCMWVDQNRRTRMYVRLRLRAVGVLDRAGSISRVFDCTCGFPGEGPGVPPQTIWTWNSNSGGVATDSLWAEGPDLVLLQEHKWKGGALNRWHKQVRKRKFGHVSVPAGEGPAGGASGGVSILFRKPMDVTRYAPGCRTGRVVMAEVHMVGMPRFMAVSVYFHTGVGPHGRNAELLV